METTELPGNDASWYRALLEDTVAAPTPGEPPPTAASTAPDAIESPVVAPSPTTPTIDIPPPAAEPSEIDIEGPRLTESDWPAVDTDTPTTTTRLEAAAGPGPGDDAGTIAAAEPPVWPATPAVDGDIPETGPGEPAAAEVEEAPDSEAALVSDRELSPGERSAEMVGQLWTAHPAEGPIEGWAPDEMDRAMSSRRSFRWTSVIALLAVVALVAVGMVLLPSITRNRADAHREMMREALHDLREELPDAQSSLEVATEPTATVTALTDLSIELTALSAAATAVDRAGREPLPSTLPLTSSDPIDQLSAVSQRLEPLAATALTIQRRIANLVEYRTLIDGFLSLPELPTTADESEQADLRVTLASTQAESASILSELPEDESLSDHRDLAGDINETFATWQVEYLEALRTRDAAAAEALINDLQFQLEQLDAALVAPLAQIRRQTDTDIIDLADTIDEVDTLAAAQA